MNKAVLILSIMMVFKANAADWVDCGLDGNGNETNCQYKIENNTLTIRGATDEGNIGWWWSYTEHDYVAPWAGAQVKDVIIEDSIKNLGSYGFVGVQSENPISIPSSVETVTYASFQGVTTPEVVIPDSVTKIEGVAFYYSDIERLNVPSSVTSMDWAFRGAQFTDIIIPDSVQFISDSAFSDCQNLKSITIGEDTVLGSGIFIGGQGDEHITDVANLKIYCTGDTAKCDEHLAAALEAAGYPAVKSIPVTTKTVNGRTYVYDSIGRRVAYPGQYNIKRIYTLEEANRAAGHKNTVMIRYK